MTEKETNQHCTDGHLAGDFVLPAKKKSEVKKILKETPIFLQHIKDMQKLVKHIN